MHIVHILYILQIVQILRIYILDLILIPAPGCELSNDDDDDDVPLHPDVRAENDDVLDVMLSAAVTRFASVTS